MKAYFLGFVSLAFMAACSSGSSTSAVGVGQGSGGDAGLGANGGGGTASPDGVVLSLAVGDESACGLFAAGLVACAGRNHEGQLGNGTVVDSQVPVHVLMGATSTSVGATGACAILADGSASCWGTSSITNGKGPLPTTIAGVSDAKEIHVGSDLACVRTGSSVMCWGSNGPASVPTQITGLTNVAELSFGSGDKVCAVQSDHTTQCWSPNETTATAGPLTNVAHIGLGSFGGCAVLTDATVSCWGGNSNGQVGNGSASSTKIEDPHVVAGLSAVAGIAVGYDFACAWKKSGEAYCWGSNDEGAVGDGTYADRYVPTRVMGLDSVQEIQAYGGNACARLVDGSVRCWGHLNSLLDDGKHTSLEDSSLDFNVNVPIEVGL